VNKKGKNTTMCNVPFLVFYHRDVSRYVQYWSHRNIYIVNHSTLHNFNRDCEGGRINPHYMKTVSGQPGIWTKGKIRTARHLDSMALSGQPGIWIA
jgi:hypothetical protein